MSELTVIEHQIHGYNMYTYAMLYAKVIIVNVPR